MCGTCSQTAPTTSAPCGEGAGRGDSAAPGVLLLPFCCSSVFVGNAPQHVGSVEPIFLPHHGCVCVSPGLALAASPACRRRCRLMQMLWGRGEPVIVRGVAGRMGWTPEGMARVCKDGDK